MGRLTSIERDESLAFATHECSEVLPNGVTRHGRQPFRIVISRRWKLQNRHQVASVGAIPEQRSQPTDILHLSYEGEEHVGRHGFKHLPLHVGISPLRKTRPEGRSDPLRENPLQGYPLLYMKWWICARRPAMGA